MSKRNTESKRRYSAAAMPSCGPFLTGGCARRAASLLLSICLLLLCTPALHAQFAGKGSIMGLIMDSSGAAVPGAVVKVTGVATGVSVTRKTSESGNYNVTPLDAGEYTVQVTAKGFNTTRQEHVRVDALQQVGLNITLNVGAVDETIVVNTAPAQLDTASASLDTTIENSEYTNLPLQMNGGPRDPAKFINLVPGVTVGNSGSAYSTSIFGGTGSQGRLDEIYYDGMPVTSIYIQGDSRSVSNTISVEAVDQFQVVTSVIPAQYQGAGIQNYTIKSGGNKFHGSLFEYFRNTALDSWGFFTPYTNKSKVTGKAVKPFEHQNEFGLTLGGPAIKKRIFFFGAYDGYRYSVAGNPNYYTIPTLAERNGDFSALSATIYDPATTSCTTAGVCSRTALSYQNTANKMDPARISTVASKLQSLLPTPINSNLTSNYLGAIPSSTATWSTTNKIDFVISDKHHASAVIAADKQALLGYTANGTAMKPPYINGYWWASKNKSIILEDSYAISSKLMNELRYGFFRFWGPVGNPNEAKAYGLGTLGGMSNLPTGQATNAFPTTTFTDPNVALAQWAGGRAYNSITNNFTLQDDMQYTHGKHSFTFGVLHQWLEENNKAYSNGGTSPVTLAFNSAQTAGYDSTGSILTSTGNAYASFLLGRTNQGSLTDDSAYGTTGARIRPTSLYVQDDYKLNSRLTINLGVRWDFFPPMNEVQNRMSFLNPTMTNTAVNAPGALQFVGSGTDSCHCSSPLNNYYKNFGPRLGVAYSLNSKTVLRGGYGISYTHATGLTGISYLGTGQLGYAASPSFSGVNGAAAFLLDSGFPTYTHAPFINPTYGTGYSTNATAQTSLSYADASVGSRAPYAETWNIGFERMLTHELGLKITYGHPGRGRWANQLDPKYYVLGSLLNSTASTANVAAAAAILPGVQLPYATFSGTIGQMLRPFPQYSGINDVAGNVSNSTYNALQITLKQQMSHGLLFTFNYTRQHEEDDEGAFRSAYLSGKVDKSVGTVDMPNVISFTSVYALPFGKGQRWGNTSRIVRAAVSDWKAAGIYTYSSGTPLSISNSGCVAPYSGSCFPNKAAGYTGNARINGKWGAGVTGDNVAKNFLDTAAFAAPANYTFGNVARTAPYDLRGPANWDIDFSLKRDVQLTERIKMQFDASAYNLTNSVIFSIGSLNSSSSSFGRVTGQANSPRDIQLALRFNF